MREVKRSALVARTPAEMFELVNDIGNYPKFVPGCHEAVILAHAGAESLVRLGVHRGVLRTHFTTRNRLEPPHRLHMKLEEGPFNELEGEWRFQEAGSGGCRVEFVLRFEFANRLKAALFEPLFEHTVGDLVKAFAERARHLPPREPGAPG
ncbi:MAG: type II toxin-antitoxin system RatA family toxin [Steroidobacteraceae bacterium]